MNDTKSNTFMNLLPESKEGNQIWSLSLKNLQFISNLQLNISFNPLLFCNGV